eukprot:GILI01004777.1.p1 GENE.GILI01004777.1~~GILI01004777.1.p1  ORF type:complete len:722 (-),score=190.35 GILI01004777.1:68-2143(-)
MPATKNNLLRPWDGPRGGFPKFEGVDANNLRQAIEAGMQLNRDQINALVSNPDPANFENTIAVLEDTGREYQRASGLYGIYVSSMNIGEIQALETEMEPKIAAFADEIIQNDKLFQRIKAVYDNRKSSQPALTPEQERLVTVLYENFHRNGASLNDADKKRLGEVNTRLASLYSKFGQNLLVEEGEQLLILKSEADLEGLDADLVASCKSAAEEKKLEQPAWAVMNTRSAMEPFLTTSSRRDLRQKAFKLFVSRGENDGPNDNRPLIKEILELRQEKATLLGFKNFAEWILSDNMAAKPETATKLMEDVWKVAVVKAKNDIAEMAKIAAKDGLKDGELEAWDHRYYAEKLRKAVYDLDDAEVKPYLQLDKMIEGMMWSAEKLHGLKFEAVPAGEVSVWHPDVRVFQVLKSADNSHVGLFYLDPYARAGKRSGAWMNDHRPQEAFKSVISPIISNNSNFMKASEGEANLIGWDDANTLFHEFGHGLHGLLSKVQYPSLAGTSVRRDFVELPSQLNEHWLFAPEILNQFARHYKTNEPIPEKLLAKIVAAKNADQGFSTVEYLASAIYDMSAHTRPVAEAADPKFEKERMKSLGLPKEIEMRHRPTHFQHIYCTEGYASAYYSYLWADALTADAAEAFTEQGSMYHEETARKLRECILQVGNSIDPAVAYRNFRGRDADPQAVMRKRGFAPPK